MHTIYSMHTYVIYTGHHVIWLPDVQVASCRVGFDVPAFLDLATEHRPSPAPTGGGLHGHGEKRGTNPPKGENLKRCPLLLVARTLLV